MSGDTPTSRRQFLKTLGCLIAAGSGTFWPGSWQTMAAPAYRLADWTGDDFTLGHKLRNGQTPNLKPVSQQSVDFVIVGGGMAGLSSAYYLRNHNFLLLEQYSQPGGQSRGGSYHGIDYSWGPAYLGSKTGLVGELLDALSLKPVEISPLKNSWYWEKKWIPGYQGSDQQLLYKQFARLVSEFRPLHQQLQGIQPNWPITNQNLLKLDAQPFSSMLKTYDAKFISLLNSFAKSAYCGNIDQLSGYAGLSMVQDLISPSYVFKGGNPALATALKNKVQASGRQRIICNAFVWQIDLKESGATITYSDKQGAIHQVNCRHIILTAPPLVAARIVPDLPDAVIAQLLSFKFGSYLVGNFCLRKKVFDGAYDNWVDSPFSFTDLITAETPYEASGSYKPTMGQVVTLYQPYEPSSGGRPSLLNGNRQEISNTLVDQLSRLVEHFQGNLEQVVLTRWGHAMVVAAPGNLNRLNRIHNSDTGPLTLAHCSMEGLPSAESAISAAAKASKRAKQAISTKK